MEKTVGPFELERQDDVLIVTPKTDLSEIDYQATDTGVAHIFELLNDSSVKHVLVDFHKTDYFSSTALAFFVKLMKTIKPRNGRLAFAHVSDHEREILQVASLDQLWDICGSRDEALQRFGNDSSP